MSSILVIFGQDLPPKNRKWWQQFDKIIGQKEIDKLVGPGSVQEAYELISQLPHLTLATGKPLSKLINYQGFDLWWIHYDELYYKFCLPYTQYRNLLNYLKNFDQIYLFQPPHPSLFQYFFKAHHRRCVIFKKFRWRNLLPLSLGILLQGILSMLFLPWLIISRPKVMIFIGDKLDLPHDYDFRMKFIYEELRKRKIHFVEFIRSLEPWPVVLKHALKRKRAVFYPTAVVGFLYFLTKWKPQKEKEFTKSLSFTDPQEKFWYLVGIHYLPVVEGDIWSIRIIKFILEKIGIKAAYITAACSRNFQTVLGCKLAGIPTVGILHGFASKYYNLYDFMPGFEGEKIMSVDQYGLWSNWWKEYYIKNSKAYKPHQLYVSGPMRPQTLLKVTTKPDPRKEKFPIKVLFISEQLSVPEEVMPYLLAVLEAKDLEVHFKFRPYRDRFELWLKKKKPKVYKKILEKTRILRGTMEEAIYQSEVVVGSHSTAVLEALLQLKPFVFFWTNKWGDYFELKSLDTRNYFFAENPQQLIECIKKSINIPKEELTKLQKKFFGNPYQNGSKWVVEKLENFSKN